jgi:hypothetical protein
MKNTDKSRLDWLNKTGRVTKFSDGWNAWDTSDRNVVFVSGDIRDAINKAMAAPEEKKEK